MKQLSKCFIHSSLFFIEAIIDITSAFLLVERHLLSDLMIDTTHCIIYRYRRGKKYILTTPQSSHLCNHFMYLSIDDTPFLCP